VAGSVPADLGLEFSEEREVGGSVLALGRAAALPHPIDLSACFTFLFMKRDLASLALM
jgi:hypothetical protein